VRDIAVRIRRPHEDVVTVVDRIRGWTDVGLLKAVGEKHPGTGRKRRYPETTIYDALLLTALLDVGIDAVRATQFHGPGGASILSLGRQAAQEAQEAQSDDYQGKVQYLVILGRPGQRGLNAYSVYWREEEVGAKQVRIVEDAEWSIVLNVSVLLKSVQPSPKHRLVVRTSFENYRKGDRIEDEAEMSRVLSSEYHNHVLRTVKPTGK